MRSRRSSPTPVRRSLPAASGRRRCARSCAASSARCSATCARARSDAIRDSGCSISPGARARCWSRAGVVRRHRNPARAARGPASPGRKRSLGEPAPGPHAGARRPGAGRAAGGARAPTSRRRTSGVQGDKRWSVYATTGLQYDSNVALDPSGTAASRRSQESGGRRGHVRRWWPLRPGRQRALAGRSGVRLLPDGALPAPRLQPALESCARNRGLFAAPRALDRGSGRLPALRPGHGAVLGGAIRDAVRLLRRGSVGAHPVHLPARRGDVPEQAVRGRSRRSGGHGGSEPDAVLGTQLLHDRLRVRIPAARGRSRATTSASATTSSRSASASHPAGARRSTSPTSSATRTIRSRTARRISARAGRTPSVSSRSASSARSPRMSASPWRTMVRSTTRTSRSTSTIATSSPRRCALRTDTMKRRHLAVLAGAVARGGRRGRRAVRRNASAPSPVSRDRRRSCTRGAERVGPLAAGDPVALGDQLRTRHGLQAAGHPAGGLRPDAGAGLAAGDHRAGRRAGHRVALPAAPRHHQGRGHGALLGAERALRGRDADGDRGRARHELPRVLRSLAGGDARRRPHRCDARASPRGYPGHRGRGSRTRPRDARAARQPSARAGTAPGGSAPLAAKRDRARWTRGRVGPTASTRAARSGRESARCPPRSRRWISRCSRPAARSRRRHRHPSPGAAPDGGGSVACGCRDSGSPRSARRSRSRSRASG